MVVICSWGERNGRDIGQRGTWFQGCTRLINPRHLLYSEVYIVNNTVLYVFQNLLRIDLTLYVLITKRMEGGNF